MKATILLLRSIWRDQEGATAIEYALIAAMIALVVATTLGTIGNEINTLFVKVTNCVANKNCT